MRSFSTRGPKAVTVWLGALLACLVPSICFAQAPATAKKVVTIEGITEYQLDNGLRLLLFPDPSTPTVTVNLTVLVGSRHEGYGETGMAHLLEHMVFKGTPAHSDIPRALRDHGANFNGTTWLDRTNYFETMPATDANLEFGIRLEADRLVNSFIKREDLLSEMTVVRNEFEMNENSPQTILSQRMMGVAYEWHNYGKSTIGNRSDIERVPIERLQAFYHKFYQPDNVLLIVAGRFDEAKALGHISKYFGVLPRPQRPLDTTYTEEPPQDGERTVVLRRVGKVGVVAAMYHIPAGPHEDFAAVQVLANVLASEPTGRLYQALVASKQATSVFAAAMPNHDPGVLEIMAEVDEANALEKVRDTLLTIAEGLGRSKFTAEEVERGKRQILKNRELLMTRSNRIGITLSDWAAQGDWRLFFLHRDRVEKVTPEDVARVASRYLQRPNRTVGLYIPAEQAQRAAIPATPAVAELVRAYKGRQALTAGEVFDPTPTNLEERVQRSQLPEGVKVALLPKKTRGEAVVAQLTLRYGNEQSLKGLTSAAEFLGPLLARGTAKHNRQQLRDELDKLGARLSADGSPTGLTFPASLGEVTFRIEAKRPNLPAVLRLLGEILREPTFPADEFDILKREYKESLEKGSTEPTELALQALRRQLNLYPKEDVRYVPTLEEALARLQAVTLEQVRQLYQDQVGAQAGELVIVGDFDPAATTPLVEGFLNGWKGSVPYRHIARVSQAGVVGKREAILTPDKANAVYFAGQGLALTDADPDYPALAVANYLFGGGPLSSRLANRVRQKEGLSYAVMSMVTASAKDNAARFLMMAICNPANIDKVDKAIREELDKLLSSGITADELAGAQKAYLEQLKVQRAEDNRLSGLLASRSFQDRTFTYDTELEAKILALTPQTVLDAVRRHVTPKNMAIIRAGDFPKQAGTEN
jgi:zinc protease